MIAAQRSPFIHAKKPVVVARRRVLNVGSGPQSIRKLERLFDPAGWTQVRIDLDATARPDVLGSMTDMHAHFEDGGFDAIWSSHSIEHLHNHEIPQALAEFRRVLRPDGFALISCPDLETVISLFLQHGPDHVAYVSPAGPITPMDMMFGHSRSIATGSPHMAHHSGLTADRIGTLLVSAGFAEAITKRAGFDLWALALMPKADKVSILRTLAACGLDMT